MPIQQEFPFSIPFDNLDPSNLGGLDKKRMNRIVKSKNRMNDDWKAMKEYQRFNGSPVPKIYHDYAKKLVDYWHDSARLNATQRKNSELTIAEETFVLDREKARVYWEDNIAAQIFDSVTRPLTKFKWDVRQHAIAKIEDSVKFGRDFKEARYIELKISNQYDYGMGWYLGYQINRFDLLENQGELFDLQYETMLEAATQMARAANEHILTGSTTTIGITDDMGEAGSGLSITGMCNNSNNQSYTMSAPGTYGNIMSGLKAGLADLKNCGSKNIILLWTSGLPSQAEDNHPATGNVNFNEWDEIQRTLIGPMKSIKSVYVSDKITGVTPLVTTQQAILMAIDPKLLNRLIVLPLQTLPSMKKDWNDDISEVMLAADILRHNVRADSTVNPFPVTASGNVTTDTLGYKSEERMA